MPTVRQARRSLQALESRHALSSTLVNGVLTVSGTDGPDDIAVNSVVYDGAAYVRVFAGGWFTDYPAAQVRV